MCHYEDVIQVQLILKILFLGNVILNNYFHFSGGIDLIGCTNVHWNNLLIVLYLTWKKMNRNKIGNSITSLNLVTDPSPGLVECLGNRILNYLKMVQKIAWILRFRSKNDQNIDIN